jgi:glutamine amidotransferase
MARCIGVIDYGVGNLFSARRGLRAVGSDAVFITEPENVEKCDAILLPGVGAFGSGIDRLRQFGMDEAVIAFSKSGKQILGICLGMQFLMSNSMEFGEHQGLNLIPGNVKPIETKVGWPVPNIGWNTVEFIGDTDATPFAGVSGSEDFYFAHSFYCDPEEQTDKLATIDYGDQTIAAVISRNNVHGCQFHPEVSDEAGLNILRLFEAGG